MKNEKVIETILALPDDANIMASGLDIDPLSAVDLFIRGDELKAAYQQVTAERDELNGLILTATAELLRLYNRHGELYTKETIDEIMQKAAIKGESK